MSDRFTPLPIDELLRWMLKEEEQEGALFGVPAEFFFVPRETDSFRLSRYGQTLETPIGVAAGPHSQLAPNIIVSWLTGARYIELKTVQTLDEIEVAKPCIEVSDEGYNCEWSQELRMQDSIDEYVHAWVLIHLLKDKFGWGEPGEAGFIFNMSVGYDLDGILKPNVQEFFRVMADARAEIDSRVELLAPIYPRVAELDIPSMISDSITLSTMHGCRPEEIERICRYLIQDLKLHTALKLNPTLLGPDRLRSILNDDLGFEIKAPDKTFADDLQYPEALLIIRSLEECAREAGVEFGLKLTNTLEVENIGRGLPDSEKMLYLSGRALHPISIHLAAKLQRDFDGQLDISFSAGADCFNVADILTSNLKPVTTCSDLLKPGGYLRLGQYLEEIDKSVKAVGAQSLDGLILATSGGAGDLAQAGLQNLLHYAGEVAQKQTYHESSFPYNDIKTARPLTAFDCVLAPCVETCAVDQDVPAYMYHTARGDYEKAYEAIIRDNPFPSVTGAVCDHLCHSKCTRINYDNPLLIREIKRFVAERNGDGKVALTPQPANGGPGFVASSATIAE